MAGDDMDPAELARSGEEGPIRAGFCAILGLPNVGKSTLLNRILGMRLVAVSRKPQTTRNRILGVHNTKLVPAGDLALDSPASAPGEPAQIIFVDTPGIQHGPGALRRYMRDQALGAAGDSDVALLLVDVSDPAQRDPARLAESDMGALLDAMSRLAAPTLLGLNKIDLLGSREELLPIIEAFGALELPGRPDARTLRKGSERSEAPERPDASDARRSLAHIIPISAHTGDGIGRLVSFIGQSLPLGPRLFPEDMVTDRAERFLAAELIREQLFRQLGQEIPYASAVVIESFRERPERSDVVIEAVIYVERDSQKGIVVGKGGSRIKTLGQRAREAITQLLGCTAHVKLHVKVASRWTRLERGIREMGYE